ncbi:hypothetical protein FVE85_4186 [Porphyridium purpureum]|uniref:Uncharacterized protein n=1 Tax=Porphyridium purpureum TaxID=35688 RepID=A0A5J4YRT7_PORPP|nr:hypothetical protein FVE85_4186 [Porphyridium purpureum]|eukprot:POR4301..scf229_5
MEGDGIVPMHMSESAPCVLGSENNGEHAGRHGSVSADPNEQSHLLSAASQDRITRADARPRRLNGPERLVARHTNLKYDFSEPRMSEVFASPRRVVATSKSAYNLGMDRGKE